MTARPGLAKCDPVVSMAYHALESIDETIQALDRKCAAFEADVARLTKENGDQCDEIAALRKERDDLLATLASVQASWSQQEIALSGAREVIAELQAMNARGREDVR